MDKLIMIGRNLLTTNLENSVVHFLLYNRIFGWIFFLQGCFLKLITTSTWSTTISTQWTKIFNAWKIIYFLYIIPLDRISQLAENDTVLSFHFIFPKVWKLYKKNHLISYKLKYDTWCQNQSLKYFSVFKISQSNFSVQFFSYKSIGFFYIKPIFFIQLHRRFLYIPSQFFFSTSHHFKFISRTPYWVKITLFKSSTTKKKVYKRKRWKSKKILSIW